MTTRSPCSILLVLRVHLERLSVFRMCSNLQNIGIYNCFRRRGDYVFNVSRVNWHGKVVNEPPVSQLILQPLFIILAMGANRMSVRLGLGRVPSGEVAMPHSRSACILDSDGWFGAKGSLQVFSWRCKVGVRRCRRRYVVVDVGVVCAIGFQVGSPSLLVPSGYPWVYSLLASSASCINNP